MGVYIKGLEMPKKCINCRFCVYMNEYPFLACFITYSGIPLDTDRLLNCPLVGIKTPHGRLIDRDAVPEVSADPFEEAGFQGVLDDMPVFLEAEGRS